MAVNNNSIIALKDYFDRHKGLQRSNRFSMEYVNLPAGLPTIPPEDFKIGAVTIGARAIDGVADNLVGYGPGRTVPRSQKFPQGVLLTHSVTSDNFIADFYDAWFNLIYAGGRQRGNLSEAFMLNYYDNVAANTVLKIKLLDLNGNTNRIYNFYEVYPIETLPVQLGMEKTNQFVTYQVLMMFRDFTFTTGE